MKRIFLVGLFVIAAALSRVGAAPHPMTVAVFDFESKEEALRDAGPKLSALVQASLSGADNIITVERAELAKVFGEQELGLSGNVSAETAANVGKLTGAKVLVVGRVFKLDKDIMSTAKIMSSETGRVFVETAKGQSLGDVAAAIAEKVTATLAARQKELAPSFVSREEQLHKLIATHKKERSARIAVTIPETHFGAPAVDPAAQTELRSILEQLGFRVVDEKSDAKPDIEITGEAFSAAGPRRGNLVSCKSRIEVSVRRKSDGAILLSDRQTSVAVDVTEQTAAKAALENAAQELAARMLVKLP